MYIFTCTEQSIEAKQCICTTESFLISNVIIWVSNTDFTIYRNVEIYLFLFDIRVHIKLYRKSSHKRDEFVRKLYRYDNTSTTHV